MTSSSLPSHFTLRMTDELRERLAAAAGRNGVPINKEIIDRLEQTFAPTQGVWLVSGAAQAMVIPFEDKLIAILGHGGQAVPLAVSDEDMGKVREFFGIKK
jgi:hypothetical protein